MKSFVLTVCAAVCAGFAALLACGGGAASAAEPGAAAGPAGPAAGFTFSGPFTHDNLTVYLIHGKDRVDLKNFLTLSEAMEQKKVVVYETKDVNELSIENTGDAPIYIQSGDIVKGGQQDRTIAEDFICPPKSGKMPIASFCVESGRWRQRGSESASSFSSSTASLASKDLKLAARQSGQQQKVWEEVANSQSKLGKSVGGSVQAAESTSSLQLSLENKKVQEMTQAYEKDLLPVIQDKSDAIGYAFAINGKINTVDVYASSDLFRRMWPKLIKSATVEAVGERQEGKKFDTVPVDAVKTFMADAEKGKATEKKVTARVNVVSQDAPSAVLFETRDKEKDGEWLHRNYIAK